MIGGILKAAAKVAKTGAKAMTKKGRKSMANAAKKSAKNAAKKGAKKAKAKSIAAMKGAKTKLASMLSVSSISGLIGSAISNLGNKGDDAATEDIAIDTVSARPADTTLPIPISDPVISLQNLDVAIVNALPALQLPNLTEASNVNFANIIVRDDIELDEITAGGEEFPIIASGTMIPAQILELGYLQKTVEALKERVAMLSSDIATTNKNLQTIDDSINEAIDQNRRIAAGNERRRDEADVEDQPEEKVSRFDGVLKDAKEVATAVAAVAGMTLGKVVAGATALMAGAAMADFDEEQEDDDTVDEETSEEVQEEEISEAPSALEQFGNWIEKADSDDSDKTVAQSAAGALMSDVGEGLAAVSIAGTVATSLGATSIAATAAAPLAAAATAGYVAGTVLYEQTGLKEKIGDMIDSSLKGDGIMYVDQTDREEMKNKYGGKTEIETLGDLFGEGLLDTAEPAGDIVSFFKHDVKDIHHFHALNKSYIEAYGKPLTTAISDELGTQAVEEILNIVAKKEPVTKPAPIETPTSSRSEPHKKGSYQLILANMSRDQWKTYHQHKMSLREEELGKKDTWSATERRRMYTKVDVQAQRDLIDGKIIPRQELIDSKVLIIKSENVTKTGTETGQDLSKDPAVRAERKATLRAVANNTTGIATQSSQQAAATELAAMEAADSIQEKITPSEPTEERPMNAYDRVQARRKRRQAQMKDGGAYDKQGNRIVYDKQGNPMPKLDGEVSDNSTKVIPIIVNTPSPPRKQQSMAANIGKGTMESASPSYRTSDSFLSPSLVS